MVAGYNDIFLTLANVNMKFGKNDDVNCVRPHHAEVHEVPTGPVEKPTNPSTQNTEIVKNKENTLSGEPNK